jgi:hypothetical protein
MGSNIPGPEQSEGAVRPARDLLAHAAEQDGRDLSAAVGAGFVVRVVRP